MKSDIEVLPILPDALWKAIGIEFDMAVKAYVGVRDGKLVGAGGLAWGKDKCWIWLQIYEPGQISAFLVVRWARRMIRQAIQLGESEIYTPRDQQYERSEALLRLVGFEFAYLEDDKEIWRWRA